MAYTYLIGWSTHDMWYYGVRTAKTATPSDLWVKYFTSSHRVKAFRAKFGEPDVIQIRRVFATREAALKWEERVIDRMDAVWSPRWINAQNAGRDFNSGEEGRPRSAACREKIRQKRLVLMADPVMAKRAADHCREFTSRPEVKAKISAKAKARYADSEWREKYVASRNTPEVKKALSERTKAIMADPVRRANYDAAITSDEYRAKKREETLARSADPEYRKRISEGIKKALASPEKRKAMSERAKAATEKRLASRERNKQAASKTNEIEF